MQLAQLCFLHSGVVWLNKSLPAITLSRYSIHMTWYIWCVFCLYYKWPGNTFTKLTMLTSPAQSCQSSSVAQSSLVHSSTVQYYDMTEDRKDWDYFQLDNKRNACCGLCYAGPNEYLGYCGLCDQCVMMRHIYYDNKLALYVTIIVYRSAMIVGMRV